MTLRRIIAGLVLAGLGSALVYAVLAALTDAQSVGSALRDFPLSTLVAMLLLSAGCFAIRSVRWGLLMRRIGYPVRWRDAFYLHLSGQTMTITPGRVGEVLKPWLARDVADMPMTPGLALVFSERLADLIGVMILSLGGLSVIRGGEWALGIGLAGIVVATAIAGSERFHRLALGVLQRQKWAQRTHASASVMSEVIQKALDWRTLSWSVPASVVAWGLEGLGMWLCLRSLGFDGLDPLATVAVSAIATIIGALTLLPGGIGMTEASMAGLLIAAGMQPADASAATLITRIATLWWGVAVGWMALLSRPKVLRHWLVSSQAADAADAGEAAPED